MKNIILLNFFILSLLFSGNLYSQSVGLYFSPTQYNQDEGISYNNLENRLTTDIGIYYNLPLTTNLNFQFGFSKSKRISEMNYNFSNCKVFEDFINIPVTIEMTNRISEKTTFVVGLGPNMTTIYSQELLFPDNIQIPNDFKTKYEYASYYKFGFVANLGIKHTISKRCSLVMTANSQYEFEKLSLNPDNNPAFFYRTFSLNFGIEILLKKK